MPTGTTPEEEQSRQEQEQRRQKTEKGARQAWLRALENEREVAEAKREAKKKTSPWEKRRVSFDSSRNQTHLYSLSPQLNPTPAKSTDASEPSHELLSERYQLLVKEIASLRAEFAELEALQAKEAEAEALARKKQEHETAWKEQERHRQKAEEEALKAKEAEESVLARIRQEGEAARREHDEALAEEVKSKEAEEKALARVKQEYEARKEQERRRQMEKEEIARKRGLENERPSTSQAYPRKPEQDHSHLKHHQHVHPSPRQTPPTSAVPVGLSGLPAGSLCSDVAPDVTCYRDEGRGRSDYADASGSKEKEHLHQERFHSAPRQNWSTPSVPVGLSGMPAGSMCSDEAPEVARYKDEGRGRSGYTKAYGSKHQEHSHQNHLPSAPRPNWSTPPVPAWKSPTPESQVTKQTLVIPAQRDCHAGVETPQEQWPLPPTPALSNNEPKVLTLVESEKEKLQRELQEAKREYEQGVARLRAELERKGRGHGASSVALWQTGCKSVWEDPTKITPENTANDSSRDVAKVVRNDVAVHTEKNAPENDTRKSRWERATEGPGRDPNVDRNGRSLSRTTTCTRYYEAEAYLSPSDDDRKERLSKAHARAKSLKLKLPVGTNPPYVPPTPYWHPSPPPSLRPTPPKRSSAPAPAVAILSPSALNKQNDYYRDLKTPVPPGSWLRDELDPKNWPANVSTPSVCNSPPPAAEKKVNPAKYGAWAGEMAAAVGQDWGVWFTG